MSSFLLRADVNNFVISYLGLDLVGCQQSIECSLALLLWHFAFYEEYSYTQIILPEK